VLAERIEDRRRWIRQQEHVRLLDLLEAPDRRPVEAETVDKTVLGELVRGHREVLHEAGKVTEAKVDDLDSLVLHQSDDLGSGTFLHLSS